MDWTGLEVLNGLKSECQTIIVCRFMIRLVHNVNYIYFCLTPEQQLGENYINYDQMGTIATTKRPKLHSIHSVQTQLHTSRPHQPQIEHMYYSTRVHCEEWYHSKPDIYIDVQ